MMCLIILVIPYGPLIIEREKPTWQKICSISIKYVPKQKPNTRPISSLGGGIEPPIVEVERPTWLCSPLQLFPASKAAALAGFASSKFSNQTQKLSSQTTSQNLSNQQAVTQNSTPYINGSQLIPQLCLVVFRLLIA